LVKSVFSLEKFFSLFITTIGITQIKLVRKTIKLGIEYAKHQGVGSNIFGLIYGLSV